MGDRDTGTRIGRRLYLGWNVGGWMGKTDCLAGYVLAHGGSLMRRIQGQPMSLMKDHGDRKWTLENLARLLDPQITLDRFDRVVLGIHAPLGLPLRFTKSITAAPKDVPPPEYGLTQILDSRLAFRVTDRVVSRRFDLAPVSASIDRIANNASKARAVCAEFLRENPKLVIPPFQKDDPLKTRSVVIEVEPEVWWTEKWSAFTNGCIAEAEWEGDKHMRDAATCALNAVWYDLAISGIPRDRFPLRAPADPGATPVPEIHPVCLVPEKLGEYDLAATDEDRAAIPQEGWIFAPDRVV